jgi:hypothetical protein
MAHSSDVGEIFAEIEAGMELEHDEIREQVKETAEKVRDYARSIAPVYQGEAHGKVVPGGFRDSILEEEAPDHDGLPAARVSSYSRIAHLLEFGTVKMHEFATFGNTAAAFGGTVDEVTAE